MNITVDCWWITGYGQYIYNIIQYKSIRIRITIYILYIIYYIYFILDIIYYTSHNLRPAKRRIGSRVT